MKKLNMFLKGNGMKTIFVVVVIVLVSYFIFFLPKLKQIEIVNQQNCSKKAEEFYLKNKDSNIAWLNGSYYTNHFNKDMNKCFVIIKGGNLNTEYHSALYDIYENKEQKGVTKRGQSPFLATKRQKGVSHLF